MNQERPGQLNRRTLLRGAGAALALPALDCMAASSPVTEPRRLAAIYFPFGVSIGAKEDEKKEFGGMGMGMGMGGFGS